MNSDVMKGFVVNLTTEYANMCTQVIAPSRSIADLIRERGVTKPIEVIPTGIDTEAFKSGQGALFRMRTKIPEDALVIGHVGRLAPEKNLIYLAKAAAAAISEKLPSAYFLVVGSGPSEGEIKDIFLQKQVHNHLVLTGKLTGRDLYDAYNSMDLFVFSSKSETQGMVLAEAMAAGKPVIALNASGVREVVKDGENGRLLSADAPVTVFSNAIFEFFAQPEIRRKWQAGARHTADQFSRNRCCANLLNLYESIIDNVCLIENYCAIPSQDPLEKLQRRIAIEWEILSQKTSALEKTGQKYFNFDF